MMPACAICHGCGNDITEAGNCKEVTRRDGRAASGYIETHAHADCKEEAGG